MTRFKMIRESLVIMKSSFFKENRLFHITAVSGIMALLNSLLMAATLTIEDRGGIALILQVTYILSPFINLGISVQFLKGSLNATTLKFASYLIVGFSVVLLIIFLAISMIFSISTRNSVGIFLALFFACGSVLQFIVRGHLVAEQLFSKYSSLVLTINGIGFFISALLWIFKQRHTWEWLLIFVLQVPYWFYFAVHGRKMHMVSMRKMLGYYPIVFSELSEIVALRLDRILLAYYCGTRVLAIYVVTATLAEVLSWIAVGEADSSVIGLSGFGFLAKNVLKYLLVRLPLLFITSILLGAFNWFIVLPLLGGDYVQGRRLILPLAMATFIYSANLYLKARVIASGRPADLARINLASVISAVIIYPLAIHHFKEVGAAWGSFVVYSISFLYTIQRLTQIFSPVERK